MPPTKRNHFVPQFYLANFADSERTINRYRLLVPNSSVADWKTSNVAATGYQHNLYTSFADAGAKDETESWLNREFESPAAPIVQKVIHNERLDRDDYRLLMRFLACQMVRTPAYFLRNRERWLKWTERELREAPQRIPQLLEAAQRTGIYPSSPNNPAAKFFPISVKEVEASDPKFRKIETTIVVGRSYWLFAIRHILTATVNRLSELRWTILEAPIGMQWFTSDDPVVQYQRLANGQYALNKGGWEQNGTVILLPLSPRHLFYTEVGSKSRQRGHIVTQLEAAFLRRIIAEHAHRVIFSRTQDPAVPKLRRRHIDREAVISEQLQWQKWHSQQSEAEQDLCVKWNPEVAPHS